MKRKSSVTQKQVAKEAGVSQTAVSLIFNGDTTIRINEDTRKHVLDIAEQMGYVPQAAARSLVQGHSNNLALVLLRPHRQVFNDPYIPNIITGFSEVARQAGFRIVVEHIDDLARLSVIRTMLKGGEVAGIVLSGTIGSHELTTQLTQEGHAIVALDSSAGPSLSSVAIDHLAGVDTLAKHLVGIGYRRIACITYASLQESHIQKRLKAYQNVLKQNNCDDERELIRYGNYDPQSGYIAMKELLNLKKQPEAVYCMNDLMAMGAMAAIREAGLSIPDDIAIVGYDDMRFAAFTAPALTTMQSPEIEQGRKAASTLIANLKAASPIQEIQYLNPELVIRESCGWQKERKKMTHTVSQPILSVNQY